MWGFTLRHNPQEGGTRPPPCSDLLWGYAGRCPPYPLCEATAGDGGLHWCWAYAAHPLCGPSGRACHASTRAARVMRGGQRHSLRTNPSMTVTPCSRYSTRSFHIQTSEHAVVVFPRRVRVRHRVSPSMCHVPCLSRERAMECSVPSGRKCCDQCVSSVMT